MKHCIAGMTLLIFLPFGFTGVTKGDKAKDIQGTWKIVSFERLGDKMPAEVIAKTTVKITADQIIVSMDGRDEPIKYRLNTRKKPMEIDLVSEVFVKGVPKAVEEVQPGILELKGDVLQVCVGVFRPGKKDGDGKLTQPQIDAKRPSEFKAGSNTFLMVLKRQK